MEEYECLPTTPCIVCGRPLTRFDGQLIKFCRNVPNSKGTTYLRNTHKGLRCCNEHADRAYEAITGWGKR